ncbi:glycosyltransferase [Maricaulis sp.]|uniref:glycosyltransferase n=1 Tax=Maricaulis sp. TaxID=1486257 RepID=UPI0026329559|nr:glycosyltransferase [Maricaulis sp.]
MTAIYGDLPDSVNDDDPPPFDRLQRASGWNGRRRDVKELMEFAASVGVSAFIIDHPGADGEYQSLLKSRGVRWLHFIGQPAGPLLADLIFCANAAADPTAFRRLERGPETKLLVGLEHALLRPQFRGLEKRITKERVDRVFVSFGGGSDRGAFRKCLPVLLSQADDTCRFTLAVGSGNPELNWVKDFAAGRRDRIDLRVDEMRIAECMLVSDLAVTASGTTTLEAAACGLPMILLAIADNQVEPARAWARRGAALYLGEIDALVPRMLANAFREMQAPALRARQTRALYETGVDGYGVTRVADAVERCLLRPEGVGETKEQPS